MQIKRNRTQGFTLVEIMIVVAIIGLLAAIAIPNFVRARTTSQMNACINNLRQIDGAIQQYALENNVVAAGAVTPLNVVPYLGRGAAAAVADLDDKVFCLADNTKVFATSYSAGITAANVAPSCSIVALTHVLK
jgi:prepilin-type N-terminal cleavage/methylation domain-containing protein